MTKWKTLSAKFTSEEIEIIKKFQEKNKLNDNQLVHFTILFTIFFIEAMSEFVESKYPKIFDSKYKKVKREILKYPSLKKQVPPLLNEMYQAYEKNMEKIADKKGKELGILMKKRQVGRPKASKKSRGRPKD